MARFSAADFLAKATMIPKAKSQLIALCSDRELPTLLGKVASGDNEKTVKIAGCKAFHGLNELKVLDAKKCDKIKEQFYALKDNKRAKKNLEEAIKQYNGEIGSVFARTVAGIEELVKLEVVKHRGHYENYHIENLLVEGGNSHYTSYEQGPPEEDWFIFRMESMQRFIPKRIVILNAGGDTAVKKIAISGSSDYHGGHFTDWIQFDDISRRDRNYSLSNLPVDEASAYSAWLQGFKYFKINILENYGDRNENYIFEFRIYGIYRYYD